MALSDTEAQRLLREVDGIRHYLFGNGKEGLDEVVRRNTTAIAAIQAGTQRTDTKLDALQRSIDNLAQERRDDNARREGSKATLNWIKWALGVLAVLVTIGGALGVPSLQSTLSQVSQQLNRIPPLPE